MAKSTRNKRKKISPVSGRSYPLGATVYHRLGATVYPEGVNFSIYSKSSTAMELLFFDDADDAVPANLRPSHPDADQSLPITQPGNTAMSTAGTRQTRLARIAAPRAARSSVAGSPVPMKRYWITRR